MSEATQPTDQPTAPALTAEQVAAWHRQQARLEQQERQQLIADLRTLAAQRGYEILAAPVITSDGRIGADWAIAKVGTQ